MSNIIKKTFLVGECDIPPTPPEVLCPVKANIIEACDSDNTIILTSASTTFNKTVVVEDLEINGKIIGYNGSNINGKILSGTTNGFELVDFPIVSSGDIYVTGGTYSAGTITLFNNSGGTVTIGGLFTEVDDIHTTGFTFNNSNYDLTIFDSNGDSYTQNLGILSSDITITGGTYNSVTGVATFTNNSGGTFSVSGFLTGFTDIYTTGVTFNANTLVFNRTDAASAYTVSLSGLSEVYYPLTGNPAGYLVQEEVEEYADLASFPLTGTSGVIYVALDTGLFYSWDGLTYISSAPPVSFTTLQQAYNASPNGKILLSLTNGALDLQPAHPSINFTLLNRNLGGTITAGMFPNGTVFGSTLDGSTHQGGTGVIFQENFGVVRMIANRTGNLSTNRWDVSSKMDYAADYSTYFNDRSLIDRGYANSNYLNKFSGGTVSGGTIFTGGLSANTLFSTSGLSVNDYGGNQSTYGAGYLDIYPSDGGIVTNFGGTSWYVGMGNDGVTMNPTNVYIQNILGGTSYGVNSIDRSQFPDISNTYLFPAKTGGTYTGTFAMLDDITGHTLTFNEVLTTGNSATTENAVFVLNNDKFFVLNRAQQQLEFWDKNVDPNNPITYYSGEAIVGGNVIDGTQISFDFASGAFALQAGPDLVLYAPTYIAFSGNSYDYPAGPNSRIATILDISGATSNYLNKISGGTVSGATDFIGGLSANTLFSTGGLSVNDGSGTGSSWGSSYFDMYPSDGGFISNFGSTALIVGLGSDTGTLNSNNLSINTVVGGIQYYQDHIDRSFGLSQVNSFYFPEKANSYVGTFAMLDDITGSTINYLPLSGGTINGNIVMDDSVGQADILFNNLQINKDYVRVAGTAYPWPSDGVGSRIATLFDISNNYFPLSGGTVNGNVIANTISASTYYNLPIDVTVTGGTYSAGTLTLNNNTGGTFSITGFSTSTSTGGSFTGGTVSGATDFTGGLTANTFSAATISALTYNGYIPLPTAASATTGLVLSFITDRVYGDVSTPESGGSITADVTGAQLGVTNVVVHSGSTTPTFSSEYKKLSGSGSYSANTINYIFTIYMAPTEIIYSINQRT